MTKQRTEEYLGYILPILILLLGLIILLLPPTLSALSIPSYVTLLFSFLLFNIAIAFVFKLKKRLLSAWSIKKSHHFILGCLIGTIPIGIVVAINSLQGIPTTISFDRITTVSLLSTFAICAWEELWFRGAAFEMAIQKYSPLAACIIFGAIFVALHAFNPQMNLLKEAAQLFLAGYCLGICYLLFRSIWAPIGMHFANNYLELLLKTSQAEFSTTNIFSYTAALGLLAAVLTFVAKKHDFVVIHIEIYMMRKFWRFTHANNDPSFPPSH